MNPLKLIPMRCSSKLPARYPDTGLHIGGGPKRGKEGDETVTRLEHIVLSLSPSRESTNFSPRILLFVTFPASSVGTSQVIRLIVLIVIYAQVRNLILEINTEDLS